MPKKLLISAQDLNDPDKERVFVGELLAEAKKRKRTKGSPDRKPS